MTVTENSNNENIWKPDYSEIAQEAIFLKTRWWGLGIDQIMYDIGSNDLFRFTLGPKVMHFSNGDPTNSFYCHIVGHPKWFVVPSQVNGHYGEERDYPNIESMLNARCHHPESMDLKIQSSLSFIKQWSKNMASDTDMLTFSLTDELFSIYSWWNNQTQQWPNQSVQEKDVRAIVANMLSEQIKNSLVRK